MTPGTEVVITSFREVGMMSVKLNRASKGFLAMALSLACALPVAAQNTTGPSTTTATTTPTPAGARDDTAAQRGDDHGNWGWLGLLGLAGLFGLRRDRDSHATDRTRTASAR